MRALIVDDDPDSREILGLMIEPWVDSVILASSAAEAFDLFRAERPDVVFSDIGMPGEDGRSLIRRIRALAPELGGDVIAIAVTAYSSVHERARWRAAGFDAVIAKPVAQREIRATVRRAIGAELACDEPILRQLRELRRRCEASRVLRARAMARKNEALASVRRWSRVAAASTALMERASALVGAPAKIVPA